MFLRMQMVTELFQINLGPRGALRQLHILEQVSNRPVSPDVESEEQEF